ncbi:MAG: hypothetical protein M3552_22815, partial [Planctomycetota bacterium]|nr:hypothetical protein [Planctomycetota bacterium]
LIAAVVFGILWSRNRKTALIAIAVACLVAIPLVFVVEQAIVTPAEEVELQIDALRNAVVRDDVEATLDFFSQSAVLERAGVATGMTLVRVEPDVRVTDVSVKVTAEDTVAVSHLRANGTFVGRGGALRGGEHHTPTRWRVSWRKEAGEWKIFGLERLDPITGEKVGILSAK